jgi:hypothetical protein
VLSVGRPHRSRPKTYTLNVVKGVTEGEPSEAWDVQPLAQVGGEYQSKEIKEDIHPSPASEAAKVERFVSTAVELSVLIGPALLHILYFCEEQNRAKVNFAKPNFCNSTRIATLR